MGSWETNLPLPRIRNRKENWNANWIKWMRMETCKKKVTFWEEKNRTEQNRESQVSSFISTDKVGEQGQLFIILSCLASHRIRMDTLSSLQKFHFIRKLRLIFEYLEGRFSGSPDFNWKPNFLTLLWSLTLLSFYK